MFQGGEQLEGAEGENDTDLIFFQQPFWYMLKEAYVCWFLTN